MIATNTAGSSSPATEVNATPTVAAPAAVTNYDVMRGLKYGNPAYLMLWDTHPDEERYGAFGALLADYYYIYWSSDMNTPIDRTDNSTYDGELLQNSGAYNSRSTASFPFVEGTQYHFAIYFYDASKRGILSEDSP